MITKDINTGITGSCHFLNSPKTSGYIFSGLMKIKRLTAMLILAAMATGLCGCPPLKHKIFVRNTTRDTAYLTLIYTHDTLASDKKIEVKAIHEVVPIKFKTLYQMNDSLLASVKGNRISLAVPPRSTIFLSDMLNSFYVFSDKTLIVQSAGKSDTMKCNYPYKDIKDVKRRRNRAYNFFYRTTLYFDIK